MRFPLVVASVAVVLFSLGCSSYNPASNIAGPTDPMMSITAKTSPPPPGPTITPPTTTPAGYGTVSNLDMTAGTFTLTFPNGTTRDVTFTSTTIVRYLGGTTDVGSSVLQDGLFVTVAGSVVGLPSQAKTMAQLIIIDNSAANQATASTN